MDAVRHDEVVCPMPAGTVEDDDGPPVRPQLRHVREVIEHGTHRLGIDGCPDHVHGFARARADERVQVPPLVLAPGRRCWTFADLRPYAALRGDQSEPRFVFGPDLDLGARVGPNDVVNDALKPPFLKASWASLFAPG